MLESQQSAQTTHKDRMDDFFDKLEAEGNCNNDNP